MSHKGLFAGVEFVGQHFKLLPQLLKLNSILLTNMPS